MRLTPCGARCGEPRPWRAASGCYSLQHGRTFNAADGSKSLTRSCTSGRLLECRYLDFTKTIEQVDELRTQMAARQARRKIDRDGDTGEVRRRSGCSPLPSLCAVVVCLGECCAVRSQLRCTMSPVGSPQVSTDRLRQLLKVIADDEKSLDNKIALHYRMLMAIDTRLERRKMHEQVALEQNLATGVTNDGACHGVSLVAVALQRFVSCLRTSAVPSFVSFVRSHCRQQVEPQHRRDGHAEDAGRSRGHEGRPEAGPQARCRGAWRGRAAALLVSAHAWRDACLCMMAHACCDGRPCACVRACVCVCVRLQEETDYEETDRLISAVETDQLRLLTMFILCNKGLDRKTIKKMMDAAALTPAQRRTIDNLENIKVKMERMVSGGHDGRWKVEMERMGVVRARVDLLACTPMAFMMIMMAVVGGHHDDHADGGAGEGGPQRRRALLRRRDDQAQQEGRGEQRDDGPLWALHLQAGGHRHERAGR